MPDIFSPPVNPIVAATQDDPRSCYTALTDRDLYFDPDLRCWVAVSANAVRDVLSHPCLSVRPVKEPVPMALMNTPAGSIFASLVRMMDGPRHAELKAALETALASVRETDIRQSAEMVAGILTSSLPKPLTGEQITHFSYLLPSAVFAHWFGVAPDMWKMLGDEVLAFVRCIAPGGNADEIVAGIQATRKLERRIQDQLAVPGPLLQRLAAEIEKTELTDKPALLLANAIGLLFQACEGSAGLIGQALLLAKKNGGSCDSDVLVETVLAETPPIQNTRRCVDKDATVSGCPLHDGDAVLAVLCAGDESLAFGHGRHACPGEGWARMIAAAGIDHLLQTGFDWSAVGRYRWRRSLNARVPEFF